MTTTNATPQNVTINAQVLWGLSNLNASQLLSYTEPTTTTALFSLTTTFFAAATTNNQTVNLATLFPNINSAILYGIADISNPGVSVSIGLASGGTRFTMAAGGFFLVRVSGSSPTVYIDNAGSTTAVLQIFCLAN